MDAPHLTSLLPRCYLHQVWGGTFTNDAHEKKNSERHTFDILLLSKLKNLICLNFNDGTLNIEHDYAINKSIQMAQISILDSHGGSFSSMCFNGN